jgi:hypothetical protein
MNKLIQTIVLTAVVFSPLNLISTIASATAHHNSSHVSTVAMETTKAKKKIKMKKGKKPMTTGSMKKKPAATDATMTQPATGMPPSGDSMKPTTKPDTVPSTKVKPNDTGTDSSMVKPSSKIKAPTAGTSLPSIPTSTPTGVSTPSTVPNITKPSLPSLPTGLPK